MRLARPKRMVRVIRNLGKKLTGDDAVVPEQNPEVEVTAPMRPAPSSKVTSLSDHHPFNDGFDSSKGLPSRAAS